MQCIDPIMTAMKARGDVIATGSEALHTLFEKQISSLVGQALSVGLVEYLLELLESTLVGVESPSATKALIVKTLKSMRKDLSFGERVSVGVVAEFVCKVYCLLSF